MLKQIQVKVVEHSLLGHIIHLLNDLVVDLLSQLQVLQGISIVAVSFSLGVDQTYVVI